MKTAPLFARFDAAATWLDELAPARAGGAGFPGQDAAGLQRGRASGRVGPRQRAHGQTAAAWNADASRCA